MTLPRSKAKVGALPAVPADLAPGMQRFLAALKEFVEVRADQRGDKLDAAITWRDLVGNGLARKIGEAWRWSTDKLDVIPSGTLLPWLDIPPTITGFTVSGGYRSNFLEWDPPSAVYENHSHVEVWSSATDNLAAATLAGVAEYAVYADEVGLGKSVYYWVRAVNTAGVHGAWNAAAGTLGETATDPAQLLDDIAGEIQASHLHTSLGSRIDLIDAADVVPGSVNARIKSLQTTMETEDAALASSIAALAVSSDSGFDFAQVWYFDTSIEGWTGNGTPTVSSGWLRPANHASDPYVTTPVISIDGAKYTSVRVRVRKTGTPTWEGGLYWRKVGDTWWTTGSPEVAAEPTWAGGIGIATWVVPWGANTIDLMSLALGAAQTSTDYYEIDWVAIGRDGPAASTAMVATIETAKIGYCTLSGLATDHTTRAACEAAGGTWNVGIPFASAVKQVSVSDGVSSATIENKLTAMKTTDTGLLAQWTIKIDAGGKVSGFGLASTAGDAAPSSVFEVRADKFVIAAPSGSWATLPTAVPFAVDTATNRVVMDAAWIKDATITSAKIASLAADKITAGTITAAVSMNALAFVGGSLNINWRAMIASNGDADFRGITIRDNDGAVLLASNGNLDWSRVGGWGKPADNATVGATIGVNLSGQMTAWNITSFIASAAIPRALIGTAAIGSAEIDALAVNTLHIAGNAITIPVTAVAGVKNIAWYGVVVNELFIHPQSAPFLVLFSADYLELPAGNINESGYPAPVTFLFELHINGSIAKQWVYRHSTYGPLRVNPTFTHYYAVPIWGFTHVRVYAQPLNGAVVGNSTLTAIAMRR